MKFMMSVVMLYMVFLVNVIRFECLAEEVIDKKEVNLVHAISPVAVCDLYSSVNAYEKLSDCNKRCSLSPRVKDRVQITLLKDAADMSGPKVVKCTKVKMVQKFTETWTFSRLDSQLSYEELSVSDEECSKHIKEHCPDYNCMITRPRAIAPDYSYASELTKSETYVELVSHPSSLIQLDGVTKVIPAGSVDMFPVDDGKHVTYKVGYYWEPMLHPSFCPFKEGLTMGCDKIDYEGSEQIICGGGRFAFQSSESKLLTGYCHNQLVKITVSGILYKEYPVFDPLDYKSQKLSMKSSKALSGDAETAAVLSRNAIFHVDSDVCSLQCEVAGVELRINRGVASLIRAGPDYMLVSPKGYGYKCSPLTYCTLVKPYSFCGNPTMLLIRCNGKNYYWDPKKNYVVTDSFCQSVHYNDTLSIHIGNAEYRIDDEMQIQLNQSDTYSYKMRSYLLYHGGMFSSEDLSQLGSAWREEKRLSRLTVVTSEEKNINKTDLGLSAIASVVLSPFRFFMRISNHVEILTIVILVLIVTVALLKYVLAPYIIYKRVPRVATDRETIRLGAMRARRPELQWT
ncbi:TPA_asm: G [Pinellia alphacytorhabdovirus 1]|nr:TPA_asm: G [Pinellia alphacytorhabdovirus 1]